MQKKVTAWSNNIPYKSLETPPSNLAAAVEFIYLLSFAAEQDPTVYAADDNVLWIYYPNSCFICEEMFEKYAAFMAFSGISIYGGADGFESGELTAEICEDNKYICCKKKNVSGTDFEIIRDIALKIPLESCQLVKEYAKLIGNISFRNSYLAAERTEFTEKNLNEFQQRSSDTYYRYVIIGENGESYLNSLSIEQRKKLWILYLTDGLSPIEFDDAFSAMEANEISIFPWELALRLALEETGITVSYENGYFVKNRNGSRILLDFSSDIAAEKLFIKLIFPKKRTVS